MRKFIFFLIVVLIQNTFSQNNKTTEVTVKIINHTVAFGETMRMISLKYHVPPSEIYRFNKGAADGLYRGMILQIPVPIDMDLPTKEIAEVKKIMENTSEEEMIVSKTEPDISENEKKISTTSVKDLNNSTNDNLKFITHEVMPNETLFSLAKQYHCNVENIANENRQLLKKGLKVGQKLQIPIVSTAEEVTASKNDVIATSDKAEVNELKEESNIIIHKVLPNETLYSLSKKYQITVEEIFLQNNELLKNGMKIGQTLTIKKK